MAELGKDHASQIVLGFTREALLKQKTDLDQKLATVARKLVEVHEQLASENAPIYAVVRTAYHAYSDTGYYGGFDECDTRKFYIIASYFETAYLGALAKQTTPISLDTDEHEASSASSNYSSVDLVQIGAGKYCEMGPPPDEVSHEFNLSREAVSSIVASLRERAIEANPYKDIPIKVNQAELLDVLLRREILKYCAANDPHFSIYETHS